MGPHLDLDRYGSSDQHTRKNSLETVVPASTVESSTDSWPLWEDSGVESPGKKRAARVRQSRSISEGMRGLRERLAWQHEHGTFSGSIPEPDSSWEELPTPQEVMHDGTRTSFPSVITTDSSYMGSYTSAKRSSQATGFSSTSDLVKIHSGSPVMMQDENFSVEDAIGMYADGFETPSKGSLEVPRDRSPERRGSSPYTGPKRPVHRHRRSRSVGPSESFPIYLQGQEKLSTQPISPQKKRADTPEIRSTTKPRTQTESLQSHTSEPISPSPKPLKSPRAQGNSSTPPPRDRYGFKKASHHFTLEEYDSWEQPYNEHLERRRTKWDMLMKQYGLSTDRPTRFPPRSDKIKRYIRKGIPPEWRGAAWFWYAGGPGLQKQHEGVYYTLLLQIKRGDGLKETDQEHIERDLNRTFPDNLTFKPDPVPSATGEVNLSENDSGPETPIIGALRRVLQAFAVHRPSIGYCQSLNFIAGLLLLFLDQDEEKAFLLLNVITTDYLPGTHGVSLEGANIDIAVLMASLKDQLPSVWAKIDDQQSSSSEQNPQSPGASAPLPTVSLATTPWFLTLFLTTLPIESALRVWDVLFLEGSKTLFRAGLAIFKLAEPRIRTVSDPIEVFQIVQSAPRGMLDANALMDLCFRRRGGGFGGLSQDTIERRREDGRRQRRRAGLGGIVRAPTDLGRQEEESGGLKGRFRSMTKSGRGAG